MAEWTAAQQDLAALIDRIFADGVVQPAEREELRRFWAQRGMTVSQVREVVERFVAQTWGEVMADGVVTGDETERLRAVVDGLHLPESVMPAPMQQILGARQHPTGSGGEPMR